MDRETRCRLAADTIAYTAREYLRPSRGPLPDAEPAQDRTGDKVAETLRREFAGQPSRLIADLLDEARRHEMNERITGYEPREDDPDYRSPPARLEKALRDGLAELHELTNHVCRFSEESEDLSCPICGNSGLV